MGPEQSKFRRREILQQVNRVQLTAMPVRPRPFQADLPIAAEPLAHCIAIGFLRDFRDGPF